MAEIDEGQGGRALYACLVNKLANCLRLLASCAVLARREGRALKVYMGYNGVYSREDFESLFGGGNEFEFVDELPPGCRKLGAEGEPGLSEYEIFNEDSRASFHPYFTTTGVEVEGSFDPTPFAGDADVAITSIYAFKPCTMGDDEFLREKHAFYSRVVWHPEVATALEEEMGDLVGVHVRLTDNLQDRAKIESGQVPALEHFRDKMATFPEDTEFLVCTDRPAAAELLGAEFGGRVSTVMPVLPEIQQAASEMLLLSRTSLILGSVGSTFSYEPAVLGATELQLFEDGAWRAYDLRGCRGGLSR